MQIKSVLGLSEEGFHKIVYREWEHSSQNPPIICVHGLTRNGLDFDDLAAYLHLKNRHVFVPDIVGRGESDWLKNPLHYNYEQYLADLNTLIARVNSESIDWIGTSMGGLLGMILASLPQNPIRRLVLNDIGPQIPVKAITRLSQYAGQDPTFSNLDEAKQYFKRVYHDFGPLEESQWDKLTRDSVREIKPGSFVTKMDPGIKAAPASSKFAWQQVLLHPYKALQGTFFDIDLWHLWHKVNCPILIIQGEQSDILPDHVVEKMQESKNHIEILKIAGVGHAPTLLDEVTHSKIEDFLSN